MELFQLWNWGHNHLNVFFFFYSCSSEEEEKEWEEMVDSYRMYQVKFSPAQEHHIISCSATTK